MPGHSSLLRGGVAVPWTRSEWVANARAARCLITVCTSGGRVATARSTTSGSPSYISMPNPSVRSPEVDPGRARLHPYGIGIGRCAAGGASSATPARSRQRS